MITDFTQHRDPLELIIIILSPLSHHQYIFMPPIFPGIQDEIRYMHQRSGVL